MCKRVTVVTFSVSVCLSQIDYEDGFILSLQMGICMSGGSGARPRATEPFTKGVICVVPAVVSFLRVVAGLQRLLSFPANSELVYKCGY